jgi:putative endonuclease
MTERKAKAKAKAKSEQRIPRGNDRKKSKGKSKSKDEQQIPRGNDRKKSKGKSKSKSEQQIPRGNDRKKSKGKNKDKSKGKGKMMCAREYHFWVYILASRSRNLYVGVTNSLLRRVSSHRENMPGTYTARYQVHRLVYFEYFQYVRSAIAREKELKRWSREQKMALIEKVNPTWEDLYPGLLRERGS